MEPLISYCGLRCDECEAYLVTLANDDEGRARIAAEWSKNYGANLSPEHINCLGCTTNTDVRLGHWYECEYRICAQERDVATCGHCEDYACEKLQKLLDRVPAAKETLDAVRRKL